jgi:hypothetical protein
MYTPGIFQKGLRTAMNNLRLSSRSTGQIRNRNVTQVRRSVWKHIMSVKCINVVNSVLELLHSVVVGDVSVVSEVYAISIFSA